MPSLLRGKLAPHGSHMPPSGQWQSFTTLDSYSLAVTVSDWANGHPMVGPPIKVLNTLLALAHNGVHTNRCCGSVQHALHAMRHGRLVSRDTIWPAASSP